MIGALISGLFDFILGLVGTLIQIVSWPVNQLITNAMPDISQGISTVSTGFSTVFGSMTWAISLVPQVLLWTFTFCYGLRLVVSTIGISTRGLIRVWNLFQKIKFW